MSQYMEQVDRIHRDLLDGEMATYGLFEVCDAEDDGNANDDALMVKDTTNDGETVPGNPGRGGNPGSEGVDGMKRIRQKRILRFDDLIGRVVLLNPVLDSIAADNLLSELSGRRRSNLNSNKAEINHVLVVDSFRMSSPLHGLFADMFKSKEIRVDKISSDAELSVLTRYVNRDGCDVRGVRLGWELMSDYRYVAYHTDECRAVFRSMLFSYQINPVTPHEPLDSRTNGKFACLVLKEGEICLVIPDRSRNGIYLWMVERMAMYHVEFTDSGDGNSILQNSLVLFVARVARRRVAGSYRNLIYFIGKCGTCCDQQKRQPRPSLIDVFQFVSSEFAKASNCGVGRFSSRRFSRVYTPETKAGKVFDIHSPLIVASDCNGKENSVTADGNARDSKGFCGSEMEKVLL